MDSPGFPSSPVPNFDIASVTGPMLLGHLFNFGLLGCLAIQVYVYMLSFPDDKILVKSFVYIVFFLDLLQTGFATHYAWWVLAGGWGDELALLTTPWTLDTLAPLTALVAFLVQLFYLWRIWVISNGQKWFIPILVIIGSTATASCIAAWYAGIALPNAGTGPLAQVDLPNADTGPLAQVNSKRSLKTLNLAPAVTTWLTGSVACDIIITITLVMLLAIRRKGALAATKRITHRAIRMAIETGAVTSVAVTVELALILNASTTSWYLMLGLLITKIYSNSLLASLNSRSPIFDGGSTAFWQPSNGRSNSTNVFSTAPPRQATADVELEDTSIGAFEAKPGTLTGSRFEGEPV
ncbi:putative Transmembrane protein [Mycena sanguinolenta]|uniref:Putative Transmembrane protein n=1 Tax=Mycena sanguinolenta TaxID=230812 RepID=A0A8H6XWG4_9AGAR|nr:putative Transmembrane protein [Mycena sanguinolenta]